MCICVNLGGVLWFVVLGVLFSRIAAHILSTHAVEFL